MSAKLKKYYEENKEYFKEYYRRNREKRLAYQNEYNKTNVIPYNPAKYERNKDKIIARVLKRAKEFPEQFAARTRKRQAAKLQRTPAWLTKEHEELIKSLYKQAKDTTALTGIKHVVDHIVPLQGKDVSGLHVPWNLQIITQTENNRKKNRFALVVS